MPLPTYLMSNFPSVRPSLNLQFDSQPTPEDMTSHLASVGATFSRASIGTYTDANGIIQEATSGEARPNYSTEGVHEGLLIEESRVNLIQGSEDLDDTTRWLQNRVTVVEEAIINPKGTASAFKMSETTDNLSHNTIIESAYRPTVTSGLKYTQSFFVKKGDGANAPDIIQIASGTALGSGYQNYNISTGTLLSGNGDDATIEDYGNGWYRISMTDTGTSTGASGFLLAFTGNADSGRLTSYAGQTDADIYVWGAQLEAGSFPTSYIPTIPTFTERDSVATFLGSDGLIQTASVDVARSDTYVYVDDVLTEAGLLLEGSAENLVISSEDFSKWIPAVRNKAVINQAIAPDGLAGADLLNSINLDNGVRWFYILEDISTGTDYTASIYAKAQNLNHVRLAINKRAESSKWVSLQCDLSDGSFTTLANGSIVTLVNANVTDVGNGWYRLELTVNTTDGEIFVMASLSDGTAIASGDSRGAKAFTPSSVDDGVYFWGGQLEESSQATSYFPTERSFDSRASSATFFNASGVLSTASTNVARTDHKYIDGEWVEAGLLLEGASTNEQGYSEDLDNASGYDFTNISVAESSITTPANDSNSYLMTETSGTAHYMNTDSSFRPSILSGETWTVSIFAKKGDGANAPDIIQLTHSSGAFGSSQYANFNISTGVITDSAGGTARIEDVSNGWYRCSFTATSTSSGVAVFIVALVNNNPTATRLPSYTFSSDADVYLWGAQLEAQSQPTSYIATSGSSATRSADVSSAKSSADRTRSADVYTTATKERSADVCYIDGTAFSDFYNQEEGTFFANIVQKTTEIGARVFDANDGTSNNRILINGYQPQIVIEDGDSVLVNIDASEDNLGTKKIGAYYDSSRVELYEAGSELGFDDSFTLPDIDRIYIGGYNYSEQPTRLNGGIKKLIYFPRRLSDNELIKLTQ